MRCLKWISPASCFSSLQVVSESCVIGLLIALLTHQNVLYKVHHCVFPGLLCSGVCPSYRATFGCFCEMSAEDIIAPPASRRFWPRSPSRVGEIVWYRVICADVTRDVIDVTFSAEFVVGGKASPWKSEQSVLFSRSLSESYIFNFTPTEYQPTTVWRVFDMFVWETVAL